MDQPVNAMQSKKPASSLRIADFLSRRYELMRLNLGGTELAALSLAGAIVLGRGGVSAGLSFAERQPPNGAPQWPVGFSLWVPVIFTDTVLGGACA